MSRKIFFIQGIILIAITMIANTVLTNWMISRRMADEIKIQNSLIRSSDHIFTALTYMQRELSGEHNAKIDEELSKARESLRTPELISLRRKLEGEVSDSGRTQERK